MLYTGELARRNESGIEVRLEPVRLRWNFEEILSADGHTLHATFSCCVRALTDPAERQMLAEAFLDGRPTVRCEAVVSHFQGAFQKVAADICQTKTASELTGPMATAPLIEAIKAAGNRLAFTCGLELLAPFEIDLTSPTLEQQRAKELQQTLLKQQQEGQLKEFQRSAELIRQFNEIRKSSPDLSAGDVLRQLNPADQGLVLQTLLMASAKEKQTQAVWAVAGPNLLRIDPRQASPTAAMVAIPSSLGPLRSVQSAQGGPMLLLGARSGVLHVDPSDPANAKCYSDPTVTSQLGFNRALIWNGEIWASHGEAGIVAWKLDQPEKPAFALRPSEMGGAAARNLEILNESQLIFSSNARLMSLSRTKSNENVGAVATPIGSELPCEIIAILPESNRLIVVLKDGTVQLRDGKSLEVQRQEKRCASASAAALLPWLGSTRLLVASDDGAVLGIGLDDDLATQYLSPYQGMKSISAAADVIVALGPDRQRIVIWRSWEPRQPAGDIFIASIARHRGADVSV